MTLDLKQYQESEKTTMDLENLSSQYKNLLNQYQQAVSNYTSFLKQQAITPNYNINQSSLVSTQGQSFWGTNSINTINSGSVGHCIASCSNTNGCTGATYNSDNQTCSLRSGDGMPVMSSQNEHAIIPEGKKFLYNIQNINSQLSSVNQQILDIIQDGQSEYNQQSDDRKYSAEMLLRNYMQLVEQRERIQKSVQEYQDLNESQIQGDIKINYNYYSFWLLLVLSIIVIFILYNIASPVSSSTSTTPSIQLGGKLGNNVYYIIFAIIIIIFFVNYFSGSNALPSFNNM
jgi:hypothetical protein